MVKAACHIHSNWSYDGIWSLRNLRDAFSKRGYQALFMTEHDLGFTSEKWAEYQHLCREESTSETLIVPGIEYSDSKNLIHILTWGNEMPFFGEKSSTLDILRAVKEYNGVCVFAHPSRKAAWKAYQKDWANYLTGIEVWNRKSDGWAPSKAALQLIERTPSCIPFVGMDFHDRNQFFPLAMELNIAGKSTIENLLKALRKKQCQIQAFGKGTEFVLKGLGLRGLYFAESLRRIAAQPYHRTRRMGKALKKSIRPSTKIME